MYERIIKKKDKEKSTNLGMLILICLVIIFAYRFVKTITKNHERGGLPYVQLLNFGSPNIEQIAFDEQSYIENTLSIKDVIVEAIGIKNLDSSKIVKSELSVMKVINYNNSNSYICNITPFEINEQNINTIEISDNNNLKKVLDETKPEVLIYHTHTSEAYSESFSDTLDPNCNVVGVGNTLTEELKNQYGISVIHDTTNHCESYLKCYSRSYETVRKNLQQYGDFKLIIDLHRDSVDNRAAVTSNQGGKNVARLMFVNAKNSGTYANNVALSNWFISKANELYPGVMRNTITYNSAKFAANSGLSNNTLLIECGANCNTTEEANNSAKILARLIAEKINGQE